MDDISFSDTDFSEILNVNDIDLDDFLTFEYLLTQPTKITNMISEFGSLSESDLTSLQPSAETLENLQEGIYIQSSLPQVHEVAADSGPPSNIPVEEINPTLPCNIIIEAFRNAIAEPQSNVNQQSMGSQNSDNSDNSDNSALCLQETTIQADLVFLTQPKKFYKYCFKCDVKKKSGAIVAEHSVKNKRTYPIVRCKLSTKINSKLLLHVELYEKLECCPTPLISGHLLVSCVEDINGKPILIEMQELPHEDNSYQCELQNFYVMRTRKDERKVILQSKYIEFEKWMNGLSELDSNQNEIASNRAIRENDKLQCKADRTDTTLFIGVQAFVETPTGTFLPIGDLEVSRPIHSNELKIIGISNDHGDVDGGAEVSLTLSVNLAEEVHVYFVIKSNDRTFELKGNTRQREEHFKNNVLLIETPKLSDEIIKAMQQEWTEIKSEIYLRRLTDNIQSNKVKFIYNDRNVGPPEAKRSRTLNTGMLQNNNVASSPPISRTAWSNRCSISTHDFTDRNSFTPTTYRTGESKKPKVKAFIQKMICITRLEDKADELEKLNAEYMSQNAVADGTGNSIYHDAIASGEFSQIYKMCESLPLRPILAKICNMQKDNLLHFACKFNVWQHIRPLCNLGSTLYMQNSKMETPLHIALKLEANECLHKFKELLRDIREYPDITEAFKLLLNVYDSNGFTVLHLAVMHNYRDLVEVMLQFCEEERINVMAMQTSGTYGRTILQLAFDCNLQDMVGVIRSFIPNAGHYENLAG